MTLLSPQPFPSVVTSALTMNHYAGESGIFVSLSDRLQLPHQPQRHLSLNPIIPPLLQLCGNVKRITKPSYKAVHHDTCCWPQLLLWCAALGSDSWIKKCNVNAEFDVRPHMHTQATQKCVYYHMRPHADTVTQRAKCKTQVSFVLTLLCLCVCPSESAGYLRFTALPSPSLPKLCHEICIHIHNMLASRVNTQNQWNDLLPLPVAVVKPASFSF